MAKKLNEIPLPKIHQKAQSLITNETIQYIVQQIKAKLSISPHITISLKN
jgi:hypothetical protein